MQEKKYEITQQELNAVAQMINAAKHVEYTNKEVNGILNMLNQLPEIEGKDEIEEKDK